MVALVGVVRVAVTPVGVLGETGPVRSPHAAATRAMIAKAANGIALRNFIRVMKLSLIGRINCPS